MTFKEAKKIIEANGGKHMVKADYLFLTEYEKTSPFWRKIMLALEILELHND